MLKLKARLLHKHTSLSEKLDILRKLNITLARILSSCQCYWSIQHEHH